ncbi:MAG: amino acid ABC transporter permease [Lachnospiraceae bacterium]|nr:amino acid ABC transporter permease [Lachnospiraceae bacterium]
MLELFVERFRFNFIEDDRYLHIVKGLVNTLEVTVFALIIGVVLGVLVGIIRSSHDKSDRPGRTLRILNRICSLYLTVIRGTPVMIQLLIMYFGVMPLLMHGGASKLMVAVLTFGINSGAYVAEIIRSGIMSIDPGQSEASRSLGLSFYQSMRYVILPQAFKNVLPALANEFITLLKETSICGYIGFADLTRGGDIIRSATFSPWMPLIAVALIYLAMVLVISTLVRKLERRMRINER